MLASARVAMETETTRILDLAFERAQRFYTPDKVREILRRMPHGLIRKPLQEGEEFVSIKHHKTTRNPQEEQMTMYADVRWALWQLKPKTRHIVVAVWSYNWSCYRYADRHNMSHMTVNRHAVKGTEDMAELLGWSGDRKRRTLH